jgi:hypothetical protein
MRSFLTSHHNNTNASQKRTSTMVVLRLSTVCVCLYVCIIIFKIIAYCPNVTGPSGTIKILGVDRKLITIINFAKACIHTSFFRKACMHTHFSTKRVLCKACMKRVSLNAFLQSGYAMFEF